MYVENIHPLEQQWHLLTAPKEVFVFQTSQKKPELSLSIRHRSSAEAESPEISPVTTGRL